MGIFRSLPVDLLTKEECADLIGLNNLTLPLLTSSFCVKPHSSSDKVCYSNCNLFKIIRLDTLQ